MWPSPLRLSERRDFAKVNPLRALFWTAVINGLLAPFLLLGFFFVSIDRRPMKDQPSWPVAIACVGVATLLTFGAAIGMFIF